MKLSGMNWKLFLWKQIKNCFAYVNFFTNDCLCKKVIGESGTLISGIIEISGCFSITGFLVTMDIEKAFDSLDHSFLISVLKKFGFGKTLLPG